MLIESHRSSQIILFRSLTALVDCLLGPEAVRQLNVIAAKSKLYSYFSSIMNLSLCYSNDILHLTLVEISSQAVETPVITIYNVQSLVRTALNPTITQTIYIVRICRQTQYFAQSGPNL